MIKRLFSLLIFLPIGIVLVWLAVTNRQAVAVAIPPYIGDAPLYQFSAPLFVLLFATLLIGMIIGSCATWVKQGKHRKTARQRKVDATRWHFEAEKEKERAEELAQKVANKEGAGSVAALPKPSNRAA